MQKKNYYGAFLVSLVLPLLCYFILKIASEKAVILPPHFIYDSVIVKQEKGKIKMDTIWHKIQNFTLLNQLGDTVQLSDIRGKILVMDFFFTRCAGICPILTNNMQKLQYSFLKGGNTRQKVDTPIVQFISFSIDPAHDSVTTLKNYADRFNVNHNNWWLLTGNKNTIYDYAFEQLKVDKFSEEPISPVFIHTSRFILIDKNLQIRGYYNGLDSTSIASLARDIGLLTLEKQNNSTIFKEITDIKWVLFFIILFVIVFMILIKKNKKK